MPTTVTWTPDPGDDLFDRPETDGPFSYDISAVYSGGGPFSDAEDYGYSITPTPPDGIFTFTVFADKVRIAVTGTMAGVFHIDGIDYLLDGVPDTAAEWDDLPADAEDIIHFRPGTAASTTYTLTVTAVAGGVDPISADYSLVVRRDWTAGRDRLIYEVGLRS